MDRPKIGIIDYAIIASTLLVSAVIGVYFQISNKKKTNEEYLLAGRNMSLLPVVLSMLATFMSPTSVMGLATDVYLFGMNMAFMNIGFLCGSVISAYIFVPIFTTNGVTTVYEYLEMRFGRTIRRVMSVLFGIQMMLFNATSLFAPSLALSVVTDFSMVASVLAIGCVCTFYSTLGGMKAVLWTDAFQSIFMFSSLFVVIITGTLHVGGISNVFSIAYQGGRIFVPKFSFDISAHYTFFNVLFQGFIIMFAQYSGIQLVVQRLFTLRNLKQARIATIISGPLISSFQLLCCFCGLVLYGYYRSCDPMTATDHPIKAPDQMLPYFIISTMSQYPGLSGLCISGLFSATLSSVSSVINSLAATTSQDFVGLIWPQTINNTIYTKLFSLFYGILSIALSFSISSVGNLITMLQMFFGLISGPQLGVFILGAFMKTANEPGVIIGAVMSFCLSVYLLQYRQRIFVSLPVSNECPEKYFPNITQSYFHISNTTQPLQEGKHTTDNLENNTFHIGYMWISTYSLLVCLFVGYIASYIYSFFTKKENHVENKYLSPVRVWFSDRTKTLYAS